MRKHCTPTNLALMPLGNMVTHPISTRITPEIRQTLVKSFTGASYTSASLPDTH
ncbi:MAG: DUF1414 domain-containing protein [Sodalis sp. (in: enterobacteria)]